MSLVDATFWPAVLPFVRVQTYDRDGGHKHPRHRIEIEIPRPLATAALALTIPCVRCRQPVRPFRQRRGDRTREGAPVRAFVAVTCPLAVSYGCARSHAAAAEYQRIVDAVIAYTVEKMEKTL